MSFNRPPPGTGRIHQVHLGLGAVIVLVGVWLRLRGASGELWFDEIWSLNTAMGLEAWHEAFWKQPKDNNHPVNTWWLYMMGPGRDVWVYHFLSVILGAVSIIVAGWIAARNCYQNAAKRMLIAMLLVAVLYPFVNFGSEARGYGPMMLFALLAFAAIENPETNAWQARWHYGWAGLFGVISHLGMLPILFALSLCFAIRQLLQGHSFLHAFNATVRLNGPFVGALLVFVTAVSYGVYLNNNTIEFGGSTLTCLDRSCFVTALDEMTRFMTGGFGEKSVGLHTGFYIISVLGSVVWLGAIGNRRALPLGLILLGVPLIFFAAGQPALPHGRYFFAVFVFFPLLITEVMAELLKRGKVASFLSSLALIVFVGANAWAVKQFLQTGRGNTHAALDYILESSPEGTISIGTEMKYQLKTVMDFNRNLIAPDRSIEIIKFKNIPTVKPKWLISVTLHVPDLPPTACTGGLLYTLVHGYGHWGMAGSTWGLYALSDKPAPKGCQWLTDLPPAAT